MRKYFILLLLISPVCITAQQLTPVPFNKVQMEDAFWQPRMHLLQTVLLPHAFNKTRPAVENLIRTGNYLKGIKDTLPFPHRYITSDLFKVMEGAAYLLKNNPDKGLERKMDSIIAVIVAAQAPDGYMYDAHITGSSAHHAHWGGAGMGDKPYSWVVHSHELYNMGHMYEAAVAYFNATGKRKWLEAAEKNARHINRVFFEGDSNYNNGKPVMQAPGHQEIELALVKLFYATGDSLYLRMAQKFLDIRGVTYKPDGEGVMSAAYAQQHLPVAAQTKPTGHAVRAAYMYAGMADVSAAGGNGIYLEALHKIWENITDTRMHITGGLGAVHGIEGFGAEYELPNLEAYNETCAAVGNVFFNYRMFLMSGNAKYADVAEIALLNNALAGVGLDGDRFFYVNPLAADGVTKFNNGHAGRTSWFGTACCPTNIARLIPQVPGMMYAARGSDIYCVLYGGSTTNITTKSGIVKLVQKTNYPFDGKIEIVVVPDGAPQQFNLKMRVPSWAGRERFVPGRLYTYINEGAAGWSLKINGKPVTATLKDGFITVPGNWKKGDRVELHLPMPVRYTRADNSVKADSGKIAVTRGPLVYCAEQVDNDAGFLNYYLAKLPDSRDVTVHNDKMGFIDQLPVMQLQVKSTGNTAHTLKMIPYHLWNNRGDVPMQVWLTADF